MKGLGGSKRSKKEVLLGDRGVLLSRRSEVMQGGERLLELGEEKSKKNGGLPQKVGVQDRNF